MPIKSIPTLGDSNWGTPLNNHIAQLQSPVDGSINTWLNTASRPAGLTADDQGKTGVNLDTGYIEQWTGTTWINLTKMGLFTVNSVFEDLVNINPANTTRVYTAGYWTKDDFGGGVFEWDATSTKDVDGGRYFASKVSATGRWVRKMQDNVNVIHYGALPNSSEYVSKPLSSKFLNLQDAKNWYFDEIVDNLNNEIDGIAIQSTIIFNNEAFIPQGFYLTNKPIQLSSSKKVYGAGKTTVIKFLDCNGFVPGTTSLNTSVYTFNLNVHDLGIYGTHVKGNLFNDSRSGFNFPGLQNIQYESVTDPLFANVNFSNIEISSFAGHGLKCLLEFTCTFDKISVRNCGGHCIYIQGGNTTSLRNCYANDGGDGYASYRILGSASMNSCNGNDYPNCPWGIFGQDVAYGDNFTSSFIIHMVNCNLEAQNKSLELRGFNGSLTMENCIFQANLTASVRYFIYDNSYVANCVFINTGFGSLSGISQVATIRSQSNATGKYLSIGSGNNFDTIEYVDASGVNIYGPGYLFKTQTITQSSPAYGIRSTAIQNFNAEKIFLGDVTSSNGDNVQILTGTGIPAISAPVGSFYLRKDGGAGTAMYVKESGTGATGWVAK